LAFEHIPVHIAQRDDTHAGIFRKPSIWLCLAVKPTTAADVTVGPDLGPGARGMLKAPAVKMELLRKLRRLICFISVLVG
jgi:hypothetical protein